MIYTTNEYLDKFHSNNKSSFAKEFKIYPQNVNRFLGEYWYVVKVVDKFHLMQSKKMGVS